MLRAMKRVVVFATLLACNGNIAPYWSENDAGYCVEHRTDQQHCHSCTGACNDGGPPETPETGTLDYPCMAIVECTP